MADNAFKSKFDVAWAFVKRIAARVWAYLKVAKVEWIVMVSLFALDLISKSVVDATIEHGKTVTVIPYFLNFHNLHNYEAAFGADFMKNILGSNGARIFFSVFAVAASVTFVLVLIKNKGKSKWFRIAIAMFVAGAMGNCIDRMFFGYVRDFVEFVYFGQTWFGRETWYVFNIADAELVISVIMIVIYFLFMYKDTGKKKEQTELLTDELGDIDPVDATADGDTAVPVARRAEQAVTGDDAAEYPDPNTEEHDPEADEDKPSAEPNPEADAEDVESTEVEDGGVAR